jgi:hypothetical protein
MTYAETMTVMENLAFKMILGSVALCCSAHGKPLRFSQDERPEFTLVPNNK